MSRKIFRDLLSTENAKKRIYSHYSPRPSGIEKVTLLEASGRVLAINVKSPVNVPPFDRATMDGYAVKAADTFKASETEPVKLRRVGQIKAGEKPSIAVSKGETVEVGTGAMIPSGADAVVMVEYTRNEEDLVEVYRTVSPYENIQAAGSDIKKSEILLRKGAVILSREIGVLASAGLSDVVCFKKPQVAVASTGDELTPLGEYLVNGKIYDANGYAISCAVRECGCQPAYLGIIEDIPKAIRSKLKKGLEENDIVIVSGGTSAGAGDLLYRVIGQLGKPGIIVQGISAKPGKPLIIAVADGKPIFGLPGNPTSALTIFNVVVKPVLLEQAGIHPSTERKTLIAEAGEKIFSSEGRREYLPVNIVKTNGCFKAFPIHKGSGAITTLEEAEGFIEIPENKIIIEKGEQLEVELYNFMLKLSDLAVSGDFCEALYLIFDLLYSAHPEYAVKYLDLNSSGSLIALRNEEVDIAAVHIFNDPGKAFEKSKVNKVLAVRGYIQTYGLIVHKGNPKRISGFLDLCREDVIFVNFKLGSDVRAIFDNYLHKSSEKLGLNFEQITSKIKGYDVEVSSYATIETSLTDGNADVGFVMQNLINSEIFDFIPLTEEFYDYVTSVNRYNKLQVKAFLDILRSEEFKKTAEGLKGIRIQDDIGKVIFHS